LYHDTKQVPASHRLTQDVIYGVAPLGFRTLDKRLAEADFFDLFGGYTMACNMVNSVFRPDKLMDIHSLIVWEESYPANEPLPSND
jgi:hypothetical protein